MSDQVHQFGDVAHKLARNPLGIIALFIVLVYGLAGLVTIFGTGLSAGDRRPLIYFLIFFPIVVLAVFAWLVTKHSAKLFGPADFKDEANYMRTLTATASLAVATAKSGSSTSESELQAVVRSIRESSIEPLTSASTSGRNRVLWVDDRPENNLNERHAFEALGVDIELALSTTEALAAVSRLGFAAVISDMGRREGPREGYVLLDALRKSGNQTPFFIYASSRAPQHIQETYTHGGQGCTNSPSELFTMVMRSVMAAHA